MSSQLIIDARRSLPWCRRFTSDAGTAVLWIVWLLMSVPGLIGVAEAHPAKAHATHGGGMIGPIEVGSAFVAITAALLTLWNRLVGHSPRHAFPREANLAPAFGLAEGDVVRGRTSQVCTVHHDEAGLITGIETADAVAGGPPVGLPIDLPHAA